MPTLNVRDETKSKLDGIAARKRWTLAETVDALADEFIADELAVHDREGAAPPPTGPTQQATKSKA